MLLLAWLGTYLSVKGRLEQNRAAALVRVSQLPLALYRDPDGLVHRRGGSPALDRLWRAAHRGRPDAVPDDARSGDLACRLLLGLPFHLLPSASSTSIACFAPALLAVSSCPRKPRSPAVRCPCSIKRPCRTRLISRQENSHDFLLGGHSCDQHAALRAPRRLRSRRRHHQRRSGQRREARRDDERHRPDLGRQRDLARRDRRRALGRLPDRLCDASVRLLSAAHSDARRADPPRGRLRISGIERSAGGGCGMRALPGDRSSPPSCKV